MTGTTLGYRKTLTSIGYIIQKTLSSMISPKTLKGIHYILVQEKV